MRRDATFQPPHAPARPALVPAANLAAHLLAHPAPEGMVPRRRRPGFRNALGRRVERARGDRPTLG